MKVEFNDSDVYEWIWDEKLKKNVPKRLKIKLDDVIFYNIER